MYLLRVYMGEYGTDVAIKYLVQCYFIPWDGYNKLILLKYIQGTR